MIRAFYEVLFVLLPVMVWIVVLLSLGSETRGISSLPAWPFASLALYTAALRDGINTFHRDNQKDKRERELLVVGSLIGVVLSTVLLTLAVLHSQGKLDYLWSFFYELVWGMMIIGALLLFVTKSISSQRKDYGHYGN
jgi:hypothetical protein